MILAGAVLLASFLALDHAPSAPSAPCSEFLKLDHTIPLSGVKGRIDHLALDSKRGRLYVAARGNDTVEIVDLREKKKSATNFSGLSEPQGALFLDAFDVFVVSNGGSGKLDVFDGDTLKKLQSLSVGEDADNLRYDKVDKHLFVAYGRGAVGILDPSTWKSIGTMKVPAHPEAFELDPQSQRVFVNVPGERAIVVTDRATRATVATWPVESAQANYPMALIGEDGWLVVGCRKPPKLLAYDVKSGKEAAALELSGDADDIIWDEDRQRVYVSCGEGFIDVFERKKGGGLVAAGKVATRAGARTAFFAPQLKRLYLAVPEQGESSAEIRVFEVIP